jgi:hypothetical protein
MADIRALAEAFNEDLVATYGDNTDKVLGLYEKEFQDKGLSLETQLKSAYGVKAPVEGETAQDRLNRIITAPHVEKRTDFVEKGVEQVSNTFQAVKTDRVIPEGAGIATVAGRKAARANQWDVLQNTGAALLAGLDGIFGAAPGVLGAKVSEQLGQGDGMQRRAYRDSQVLALISTIFAGTGIGQGLRNVRSQVNKTMQAEILAGEKAIEKAGGISKEVKQAAVSKIEQLKKDHNMTEEELVDAIWADSNTEKGLRTIVPEAAEVQAAKAMSPQTTAAVDDIIKTAGIDVAEGRLVHENLMDAIELLDPKQLRGLLDKHNMTPTDIGEMLGLKPAETIERISRARNVGKAMTELRLKAAGGDERAAAVLDEAQPIKEGGKVNILRSGLLKAGNFTRSALTSNIKTAARNLLSAGGVTNINTLTDIFQAAIETAYGMKRGADTIPWSSIGKEQWNFLRPLAMTIAKGDKKQLGINRTQTAKILNNAAKGVKGDLYSHLMGDISMSGLGKVEAGIHNTLQVFNRMQERYVRDATFLAVIDRQLKGVHKRSLQDIFKTDDGHLITAKMIDKAIDRAQDVTFAMNPKKGKKGIEGIREEWFSKWIDIWTAPGGAFINQFPRFQTNAMRFQIENMPWMSMKTMKSLGNKSDKRAAAQALTGGSLILMGAAIRAEQPEGTEWYQIANDKGQTTDVRAFAPLSTYLYLGDLAHKAWKGTLDTIDPKEAFTTLTSLSKRIKSDDPLTQEAIEDYIQYFKNEISMDAKGIAIAASQPLDSLIAKWVTPVRQFVDLYAGTVDPDKGITRDPNGQLFGQTRKAFGDKSLPRSIDVLGGPVRRNENPISAQTSGLVVKSQASALRRAAIASDLKPQEIWRSTGNRELDQKIKAGMETVSNQFGDQIVAIIDDAIKGFAEFNGVDVSREIKAKLIQVGILDIRRAAVSNLALTDAEAKAMIEVEAVSKRDRAIIEKIIGKDLMLYVQENILGIMSDAQNSGATGE